jgi:hypothetical protein
MKLINLIKSNSWLSIELTLLRLYPDQKEIIDDYRHVYEQLLIMPVINNDMKIVLTEHESDTDDPDLNATYVDVSGKDEKDPSIGYALEFTEWSKWLGMDIELNSLKTFSELEIVAHCLFEMTFIGYDEPEIQAQRQALENSMEDFKKMTDEEKEQRTISLDDFLKNLEDDEE